MLHVSVPQQVQSAALGRLDEHLRNPPVGEVHVRVQVMSPVISTTLVLAYRAVRGTDPGPAAGQLLKLVQLSYRDGGPGDWPNQIRDIARSVPASVASPLRPARGRPSSAHPGLHPNLDAVGGARQHGDGL
jgi:hypothetical protein